MRHVLSPTDIAHAVTPWREIGGIPPLRYYRRRTKPALAPQQVLRAHPAAAALGLFFAGVELLGRRIGVRGSGWPSSPRRLPRRGIVCAGIAVGRRRPVAGRSLPRALLGHARVGARAPRPAQGRRGCPPAGAGAAQFAQPRLDFAVLRAARWRRRRGAWCAAAPRSRCSRRCGPRSWPSTAGSSAARRPAGVAVVGIRVVPATDGPFVARRALSGSASSRRRAVT